MNLALPLSVQVDGAKHDSSDLLADRRIVPLVYWLSRFLDAGDLDEPDDRTAQIDKEPERMMTQHHTRRDDSAREAGPCYRPFLVGGLASLPQGMPLIAIRPAYTAIPVQPDVPVPL